MYKRQALLTGALEETNDGYAIAKIAGIVQVQALRRQYGVHYISAMPTNLYGPNDNFDPTGSHVFPAMIRRFPILWASSTCPIKNSAARSSLSAGMPSAAPA